MVEYRNGGKALDLQSGLYLSTKNTDAMTIYKDGVKFASNTISGVSITYNNTATDFLIGKSGYGNAGLNCAIDDIATDNYAETATMFMRFCGTQ